MNQVELLHGAATDVGLVREVNEDALLAAPPVFVVADGMGGHDGGDVASAIVVEEFARLAEAGYDPRNAVEAVRTALRASHDRIREYSEERRRRGVDRRRHAGTTAVVAMLADDDGPMWLLANLGDSRIYRFAGGELAQVSVDHSLVQELVDAGQLDPAQVATHPKRNVITRALGDPDGVEADFFVLPVDTAGRLLLCSDGITGMLDDQEVAAVLADAADPGVAADRLVAAAVAAGGEDNATAVVIDVVGVP
ncbi:PP2C family serine/threonine-protein phosphatase [Nocardioides sp. SR21]|uniref:PP2C family protein-serine/threonine phosphatase n=1 Tax=Nocardioides sp. SR21 TaxID=2919501 RepID=UPI001FAA6070|nr:protein phosphatase 2C domain-containing protein [Nocardioides sp. SR21]